MAIRNDATRPTDRCPIHPRPTDPDRYAALEMDAGILIFDTECDEAWVLSDDTIPLESME